MKSQTGKKLNLMSAVLSSIFLLQSPQVHAGCSGMVKELKADYLTPALQESIDQAIHNLAIRRVKLSSAFTGKSRPVDKNPAADVVAQKEAYYKDVEAFGEYLEKYNIMTKEELMQKIRSEFERLSAPPIRNSSIRFQLVEPGSFIMGDSTGYTAKPGWAMPDLFISRDQGRVGQITVSLTKPFEIMETSVPATFRKQIVDLANARFPGKYNLDSLGNSKSLSFSEIKLWIDALNDLSKTGEPSLVDLIPGHKNGDVYSLPTEAQVTYSQLIQNLAQDGASFRRIKPGSFDMGTPTKEKVFVIDGKEFPDVHGWGWQRQQYEINENSSTNYDEFPAFSGRVIRGGSWAKKVEGVGFRLVKTSN